MAHVDSFHSFARGGALPPLKPTFWTWAWLSFVIVALVGLTIAAWYATVPNVL
jgi:hypothetical protein